MKIRTKIKVFCITKRENNPQSNVGAAICRPQAQYKTLAQELKKTNTKKKIIHY